MRDVMKPCDWCGETYRPRELARVTVALEYGPGIQRKSAVACRVCRRCTSGSGLRNAANADARLSIAQGWLDSLKPKTPVRRSLPFPLNP